jgi:hypothetical protein
MEVTEVDSEGLCLWTSGELGVECLLLSLSLSVSSFAAALLCRGVGCG